MLIFKRNIHLLGQGCVLQSRVSLGSPVQSSPPNIGIGSVHVRVRTSVPLLHGRLHVVDHSLHVVQLPCTERNSLYVNGFSRKNIRHPPVEDINVKNSRGRNSRGVNVKMFGKNFQEVQSKKKWEIPGS